VGVNATDRTVNVDYRCGDRKEIKQPAPGRCKKLANWVLVLFQIVVLCILISIGVARAHYEELSKHLVPDSTYLLGSILPDLLLHNFWAYWFSFMLICVLFKEFVIENFKMRLSVNVITPTSLLVLLGLVFRSIYSPLLYMVIITGRAGLR